jgi:asparagine synthase (glutamine-hydrolysing)
VCGIAGAVVLGRGGPVTPEAARLAAAMLARLAHRGPDDEGAERHEGVVLGARRLSIIDLAGGHQPIADGAGRVAVAQNGELYNHAELAAELRAAGRRFRTRCDTEVLVHGYAEWGVEGLLARLRGMFAFAIHDRERGRLLLARDRFGEKPLFYARAGRRFLFASELTALLASGLVPFRVDRRALECVLAVHYVPGELSAVEGVRKLPPGHWLELDVRTGGLAVNEYWDLDPDAPGPGDGREAEARVREGVAVAVRRCLVADVPVGLFLSGGLDSSVLAAEARRQGADLATFSVGFDDERLDESAFAREMAAFLGGRHVEVRFRAAEALAALADAPRYLDEPVGDPAALTVHLLARVARDGGVKVVLSGEGADELFGGYPYYDGPGVAWRGLRWARRAWSAGRRLLETGSQGPDSPVLTGAAGETVSGFPIVANPAERRRLLGGPPPPASDWERRVAARAAAIREPLARRRYADLKTWLPDDLLVKFDRMTMACSVEGRAPYLDADLAALAFALPPGELRGGGGSKRVLRRAFADRLPPRIVERRKQGFVLPLSAWIAGPLAGEFRAVLAARQDDGIDAAEATALLREHVDGRADRARLLYTLFVYRRWFARVREEAAAAAAAPAGGLA